jgi:hypothetical protein
MARYADWESIPMAQGGKDPVWPLPTVTPKFATWSLGGGRPWGCAQDKCERWHAGVDLTSAPQGAVVIAPEDALIVGVDKGWTDGTRAIFLRTDSNLFLVLGGVIAGSHKEFGLTTGGRVAAGRSSAASSAATACCTSRPTRPRPTAPRTLAGGRTTRHPRVCSTPSTTSSA